MIISIVSNIICLLCAVFCFYRIGRQQAFMDLLKTYNELLKSATQLQHTIELAAKITQKIKENENKETDKKD